MKTSKSPAYCTLLLLASLVSCLVAGTVMAANSATNAVPALLAPVALTDANGEPELDLVDPFRRRGDNEDGAAALAEDGLLRTSLGEISSEFRILAITVPADTNTPRSALIQFYTSDEPILVHEGDLVRVDRLGASGMRGGRKSGNRRPDAARVAVSRARRPAAHQPVRQGLGDIDLEEELKKYVFYLNVKHIEPTFIEVYHNKKRPDETIRLNW